MYLVDSDCVWPCEEGGASDVGGSGAFDVFERSRRLLTRGPEALVPEFSPTTNSFQKLMVAINSLSFFGSAHCVVGMGAES